MSAFTIKLIALIFMLIDHIGAFLQLNHQNIVSPDILNYLRASGRLVLPIFAYFIVVGFEKTKNFEKYVKRISIVAIISQIPFILAFSMFRISGLELLKSFKIIVDTSLVSIASVIAIVLIFWFFVSNKKFNKSFIIFMVSMIFTLININSESAIYLTNDLNIFYELMASLLILYSIDYEKLKNRRAECKLVGFLFSIIIFTYIKGKANYGMDAMILVLMIYLLNKTNKKMLTLLGISLWVIYMYGYMTIYLLGGLMSILLIALYNGQKGKELKYLFYIFYPIHLMIISIIRVVGIF